jgi:UDP-N-acetylmuramyl pentapeptide phosphotransferase/UDP-N-acetylglucosamine-1-phosphate transferase
MAVVASLVAGLVVSGVVWRLWAPQLAIPSLARENVRGVPVPTAGGIVIVVSILLIEAVRALWGDEAGAARILTVLVVGVFGGLGLLDDVLGSGADGRGFKGHARALAHGRLTTGGVKLVCGYAAAVIGCALVDAGGAGGRPPQTSRVALLLADAALVAFAANLGNLFDRAPGRTLKVATIAFVTLVAFVGLQPRLGAVAATIGCGFALLVPDLRERVMLGDTGANALGAALGFGVVLTASSGSRVAVLAALAVLNLASEAVSFSRVIDRFAPLRAIDHLGRGPR